MKYYYSIFILSFLLNCTSKSQTNSIPKQESWNAIVEIPAGTNLKYEYNYKSNSFEVEIIEGKKRTINYLPYPGNYGFIENTYMDPSRGGDGDALDVLIISESVSQGEKIPINPVGILKLLDKGQEDHKIIAVPKNSNQTYINDSVPNSVKTILKTWFCNYKGAGKMEFISWGNKVSALEEIKKWSITK